MMREAGLTIVRIGEFAWTQMEPAEGVFTWEWLDQAVEVLAGEGLEIVLGTPTAAPPAWLVRLDPDLLPVDINGHRRRPGTRRHYCANSPAYRRHTQRIVAAMARRYASHPAVIGWQIDNEFGCHDTARCYCPECTLAFRLWLKDRYGSLDALNQAWSTVFWSQTYRDWEEIEPPNLMVAGPNPSHVLDYYRFSSDSWLAYQQLQIDILRKAISTAGGGDSPPEQFICTNFMGDFPDLDHHSLARPLDLVAWDSYPTGYADEQFERLYPPGEVRANHPYSYDVGDPVITGFCHDLTRGLKRAPYWVMEQQSGSINWSTFNTGVRSGAVRLWTWHALASGASAVVYFRWRASLSGLEQHHAGLLNHDGSPATGYEGLLSMLPERELMARVSAEPIQSQVALLLNYPDLWAIQLQPHRRGFDYLRHLFVFYRALQRLGIMTDIVSPETDLSAYKLVIAPTAFLGGERLASALAGFAAAGGTVLLGVRSGFKTTTNLVTDQPLPGVFRQLVGARLTGWHALPPGVEYGIETQIPGLEGPATFWMEGLLPLSPQGESVESGEGGDQVLSSKALAQYTAGPFASQAALIENRVGAGRALYMGWYPTYEQAVAVLAYLADQAGIERLADLPPGLVASRRGPYTLLLNFTEDDLTARVGERSVRVAARDVSVIQ